MNSSGDSLTTHYRFASAHSRTFAAGVGRGVHAQNFARWDAPNAHQARDVRDDADRDALVMELKTVLSKIAYLRTLIRDIDRELDSAQAA